MNDQAALNCWPHPAWHTNW